MRGFVTTPSRARSGVTVLALFVAAVVIRLVTDDLVPWLVWFVLALSVAFLMLHNGVGAVANTASIIAGRPIALTARARAQMALHDVSDDARRQLRIGVLGLLALLLTAFVLGNAG